MGIGTTNPGSLFEVSDGSITTGSMVNFTSTAVTSGDVLYLANNTANNAYLIRAQAGSSLSDRFTVDSNGELTLYDYLGTESLSLVHDGTDSHITASNGDINIGSGGGKLYIGEGGTAVDIQFAESANIEGDSAPDGVVITLMDIGNIYPDKDNTYDLGSDGFKWANIYSGTGFFYNNVGIGTTNPSYELDVNGSVNIGGTAFIGTAASVADNNIVLTLDSNEVKYIDTSIWDKDNTDEGGEWTLQGDSGTPQVIGAGDTAFFQGGIGIGTTVGGSDDLTIYVDELYDFNWLGTHSYSAADLNFISSTGFTLDVTNDLYLDADGGEILFADGGAWYGGWNSSGNLGIGITNPLSKLHVVANGGTFNIGDLGGGGEQTLKLQADDGFNATLNLRTHASDASSDPKVTFTRNSVADYWGIGADISDAGKLKISNSNLLGTNDRLTIETGGNVGIGTTSPIATLHVTGSSGIFRVDTGTNNLFYVGTTSMYIDADNYPVSIGEDNDYSIGYVSTSDALTFSDGSDLTTTPRMVLNSSGYIGLGTTNPLAALHINNTGAPQLQLGGLSNTGVNAAGNKLYITGYDNDDTSYTYPIYALDENSNVDFWLRSSGTGDAGPNAMYLRGNFGIGTTEPGYSLDIAGDLNVGTTANIDTLNLTGMLLDAGGNPGTTDQILASIGTGTSWIDLNTVGIGGSGTTNYISKWASSSTLTNAQVYNDASFVGIGGTAVNTNPHLYVEANTGEIGIGTTNPSQILDVAGDILIGSDNTDGDDYLYFDTGTSEYLMWDDSPGEFVLSDDLDINGHLGLGTTSVDSNTLINAKETFTDGSVQSHYGLYLEPTFNFTNTSGGIIYNYGGYFNAQSSDILRNSQLGYLSGVRGRAVVNQGSDLSAVYGSESIGIAYHTDANGTNTLMGSYDQAINESTGTITTMYGTNVIARNDGAVTNLFGARVSSYNSNTISDAGGYYGIWGEVVNNAATASVATALYGMIDNDNTETGVITNGYGLYLNLSNTSTGGTMNNYTAIHIEDAIEGTQTGNVYGIWANEGDWVLDEDGNGVAGGNSLGGDLFIGEGQDLELYHDSTNSYITSNTGDFYIGDAGTDDLILQNNGGNVGIGTSNPLYQLELTGDLNVGTTANINTLNLTGMLLDDGGKPGTNGQILSSIGTGTSWIDVTDIGVGGSGTENYLTKWGSGGKTLFDSQVYDNSTFVGIGGTAVTTDPHIYVAANTGNVGIGSTSYSNYKLGIGGNVDLNGYLYMNNNQISEVGTFHFNDPGDQEGIFWTGTAAKIFVSPLELGNSDGYLRLINDGGISFEGSGEDTEDMLIDPNGNVGIGTTLPNDELDVVGEIDTSTFYKLEDATILDIGGTESLLIGHSAGGSLSTGANSVLIGYQAGFSGTDLDESVYIGHQAGYNDNGDYDSVLIGYQAGYAGGSGVNIMMGYRAGYEVLSSENILIGYNAGLGVAASAPYPSQNTIIGNQAAIKLNDAENNVVIGTQAAYDLDSGLMNTIVGDFAAADLKNGDYNTYLGYAAGWDGDANYNTAIGFQAGYYNNTGNNNVLVGAYAGEGIGAHNKANNTIIGYEAGHNLSTSDDGNVMLGYQAGYSETGANKLYIENSNSVTPLIWGDFSNDLLTVHGNMGIGTTNPLYQLELTGDLSVGTTANIDTLNLSGMLLDAGGEPGTTDQILTSTGTGTSWQDITDIGVGGSGTENYLSKWSSDNKTLLDAQVFDNSTFVGLGGTAVNTNPFVYIGANTGNVGIGTTGPNDVMDVVGNLDVTGYFKMDDERFLDIGVGNTSSLRLGFGAGASLTSGADYNTFIGYGAGFVNETDYNTYIGYQAGYSSVSGYDEVAIGYQALYSNVSTERNIAIGSQALYSTTSGGDNLAIGYYALQNSDGGGYNMALGTQAMESGDVDGWYNIGMGVIALRALTTGANNVAIGYASQDSTTTGGSNISMGSSSLQAITTGKYNIALGEYAGRYIGSTGSSNIVIGFEAGAGTNTYTYSNNTLIGHQAGRSHREGNNNTALGYQAGYYNQTGISNILIGKDAGRGGSTYTSSDYNTIMGEGAAYNIDSNSDFNTIIGYQAAYDMTADNQDYNVIIGAHAAGEITTGNWNTTIGYNAGHNSLDSTTNTFIGAGAGQGASAYGGSDSNVIIGYNAASGIGDSSAYNVIMGRIAGQDISGGDYNVMIGDASGLNNITGSQNVFLGRSAGNGAGGDYSGSDYNVLLGSGAGYSISDNQDYNVFVGYQAGYNESGSSKLYIEGSDSATPLIWGDFSNDLLTVHGNMGIGTTNPLYQLELTGDLSVGTTANIDTLNLTGMLIDSGGTPGTSGQILSSIGTGTSWIDSTGGSSEWTDAGSALWLYPTETNDYIVIGGTGPNDAEIKLDFNGPSWFTGGNVGIGTTDPNDALDVVGAIDTSTYYKIDDQMVLDMENVSSLRVGSSAGESFAAGATLNTVIGYLAGNSIINNDGNTLIGWSAGRYTGQNYNVFVGAMAGEGTGVGGTYSGGNNVAVGSEALESITTGWDNAVLGYMGGRYISTGEKNALLGAYSGYELTLGEENVLIGYQGAVNLTTGDYNTMIGTQTSVTVAAEDSQYSIAIGAYSNITANNQMVVGNAAGPVNDSYWGEGVQSSSASDFTFNATGGSGTNNPGANLKLAGGKGTGNAAGGSIFFFTADELGSGGTLQSLSEKMIIHEDGNVGIGTTNPSALLDLSSISSSTAFLGFNLDWNPASTTTLTGDLFSINIGSSGNANNVFTVQDTGSDLFSVSESQITSAIPHQFTSTGDVSMAYDLIFTNQTSSKIETYAPFTIEAGESHESNDLTLQTNNYGDLVFDVGIGVTSGGGTILFYDSNVKGATITTPIEFADSASTINTFRSNFTNETIIGALNEAAGGSGQWSDAGSALWLYPNEANDYIVIGGTGPNDAEVKLAISGDSWFTGGQLGIGTTNAGGQLEVYLNDDTSNMLIINNPHSGTTAHRNLLFRSGASDRVQILSHADNATDKAAALTISTSTAAPMYFETNNVDRLMINSTGNVGLGTTDPQALLNVSTTAGIDLFRVDDNGPGDSSPAIEVTSAGRIGLGITNNNTYDLWIGDPDGTDNSRVMIGMSNTTSPAGSYVTIRGSGNYSEVLLSSQAYTQLGLYGNPQGTNQTGYSGHTYYKTSMGIIADYYPLYIGGEDDIRFIDTDTDTERMTIETDTGNVGIGTTNPQSLVDLYAASQQLRLSGSATAYATFSVSAAGALTITTNATGSNEDIELRTAGFNDAIYIDESALQVGIGVTPNAFFLEVGGSIGPSTDDTYDLGSDSRRWANLYVGSTSVHIGSSLSDEGIMSYYTSNNVFSIDSTGDLALVNGGGNVGIGTTNPQQKLEIVGASGTGIRIDDGTVTGRAIAETDYFAVGAYSNHPLVFTTNNVVTAQIGVDGGFAIGGSYATPAVTTPPEDGLIVYGNVGIGTTNPLDKLEVFDGDLRISNDANPATLTLWGDRGSAGDSGEIDARINFYMDNGTTYGWRMDALNYGANTDLAFRHVASTVREAMYFDGQVNNYPTRIGIGTTVPTGRFSVAGGVGIGTSALDSMFHSGATPPDGGLIIEGWVGIGTTDPVALLDVAGTSWLGSNSGIGLYVNSSGYIGIGTTTPSTLLHIASGTDDLFKVSEATISAEIPAAFNAAGDTEFAYNVEFTNDTASYIRSLSPLYIEAGDASSAEDLTLRSRGSGDVIIGSGTTYFKNSGNVGIGINNPINPLHVDGTILAVGSGTSYYGNLASYNYHGAGTLNSVGLMATDGSSGYGAWLRYGGDGTNADSFQIAAPGNAVRLHIGGGGNIGIGTTGSGAYQLDVWGTAVRGNGAYVNRASHSTIKENFTDTKVLGKISNLNLKEWDYIESFANSTGDHTRHLSPFADDFYNAFSLGSDEYQIIAMDVAGVALKGVQEVLKVADFTNADTTTPTIYVNNLGNVGIGSSDPSFKLDINGGMHLASGYDLYFGNIGLGATGSNDTDSGASLIGVFDEFSNSDSQDVQSVLADLDQAIDNINGGTSLWLNNDTADFINPDASYSSNIYIDTGALGVGFTPTDIAGGIAAFSGNVGIGTTGPTQALDINGNARIRNVASGAYSAPVNISTDGTLTTATSDMRLKENITTIDNAMEKISQLRGVTFTWIDGDSQKKVGMVAQEVQQVVPELVFENQTDGYLGINYGETTGLLIEGIKEQQLEISALDEKVAILSSISLSNTGDIMLEAEAYSGELDASQKQAMRDLSYQVKDSAGNTINSIIGTSEIITAKLTAGLVNATNIVTDTLLATKAGFDIVKARIINTEILTASRIETEELIAPVANISELEAENIRVTGESKFEDVIAENIETSTISADSLLAQEIDAQDLQAESATISGDLVAKKGVFDEIFTSKIDADMIEGLEDKIAAISNNSYSYDEATLEGESLVNTSLTAEEEASTAALLAQAETWSSQTDVGNYLDISSIDTDSVMVNDFLAVFGQATITNLEVTNALVVQDSMIITQSSIGNTIDRLYIQPTGMGGLDLMAGALVIDEAGDVYINGDVYIAGKTTTNDLEVANEATVSGSLFANLLKPEEENLAVQLDSKTSTPSGETTNSKFQIVDSSFGEVASIDASGSATFRKINIASALEASASAGFGQIIEPEVNTNATAGKSVLPAYETELTIPNTNITGQSLIYITPTSDSQNKVLYVKSKKDGQNGYFTIAIDTPIYKDIEFNWWIIN
ncbi:tail fiber domain-containing protein [Patescibacteria group bacterium]